MEALGLVMCSNSRVKGSILLGHVDYDGVTLGLWPDLLWVLCRLHPCTTPRVTVHSLQCGWCPSWGTAVHNLRSCFSNPSVTWKRNNKCWEANYKWPLFWLTLFAYLFVPPKLKRVLKIPNLISFSGLFINPVSIAVVFNSFFFSCYNMHKEGLSYQFLYLGYIQSWSRFSNSTPLSLTQESTPVISWAP